MPRTGAIILATVAVTIATPAMAHPRVHPEMPRHAHDGVRTGHEPKRHHVAARAQAVPEHTATPSRPDVKTDVRPVVASDHDLNTAQTADADTGPVTGPVSSPAAEADTGAQTESAADPQSQQAKPASRWNAVLARIQDKALSLVGIRYIRGGNSPANGFDCSGFVQYVLSRAAGVHLAHSAAAQASEGQPVAREDLHTGDLVFFHTFGRGITHVGLYLGHGDFIHAPSTGKRVRVENINEPYWQSHYMKAVRPGNSGPDNS